MKNSLKYLIIIPTYNEAENITKLIKEIRKLPYNFEILIIDDNSTDGTGDIVKALAKKNNRISIIERPSKLGYATAVMEGFKFGINNSFDAVIQMDADFSHDPSYLPEFVNQSKNHQVVIGSRYIKDGGVINWPLKRKMLSYCANIYVRLLTGIGIHDATSGYRCIHREVLEKVDFNQLKSQGYAFLIENSFLFWKNKYSIEEIPITFVERAKGSSKISKKIIIEAFFIVLKLALRRLSY
jgi:dolichol-phosphate mannosyltransferase